MLRRCASRGILAAGATPLALPAQLRCHSLAPHRRPVRSVLGGCSLARACATSSTSDAAVRPPGRQLNGSGFPKHVQPQTLNPGLRAGDEDILAAVESIERTQVEGLRELVEAVKADRLQVQQQVDELSSQCAGLALQVQDLTMLLRHQGNLMEEKDASNRRTFRPTIDMVANQPTHVSQLDNGTVMQLGLNNNHNAHKERLLREIMQVEGVSWEDAHQKLFEMDVYNERHYWFMSFPYRVGIATAVIAALASGLMVFYSPVVEAYAAGVAGEDLPEGVEDAGAMTVNQVGTWSWSWMEPMIGTASFVLLCFQFARAQAWKLNMRPYTESMQRWRANRLATAYPQYDVSIVRAWAKHMPKVKWNFFPAYRRYLGFKHL